MLATVGAPPKTTKLLTRDSPVASRRKGIVLSSGSPNTVSEKDAVIAIVVILAYAAARVRIGSADQARTFRARLARTTRELFDFVAMKTDKKDVEVQRPPK